MEQEKIQINDQQEITLSQLFESSIFHEDNLRYSTSYIPEYLGMIKRLDAMCWAIEINNFNIAKSVWDAIKIKYFPEWLLAKYPAKIRNVDISFLYPQVSKNIDKINLKDFNKSQKYLRVNSRVDLYGIDYFK